MVERLGAYGDAIRVDRTGAARPRGGPLQQSGPSFGDMLAQKVKEQTGVRWSAHALERLRASRGDLSESEVARLTAAVDKAAGKGARESLILLDDLALVVSVKNRTVITAVGSERIKENVFTNIDSAVIT